MLPQLDSGAQEITDGVSVSAPPGNYTAYGLEERPAKWKRIIADVPSEPGDAIREECLTKH